MSDPCGPAGDPGWRGVQTVLGTWMQDGMDQSARTGRPQVVWGALVALGLVAGGVVLWSLSAPVPEAEDTPTESIANAPPEAPVALDETIEAPPQATPVEIAEPAPEVVQEAPAPAETAAVAVEPEPAPVPAAEAPSAAEPVSPAPADVADPAAAQVETAETAETPEDAAPAAPAADPPRFDLVRVDRAGSAVVAGRAMPGGVVRVLLDGAKVAETVADGRGSFVALFTLDPSAKARALTLESDGEAGDAVVSVETAMVSPFTGPVAARAVDPEPAPRDQAATADASGPRADGPARAPETASLGDLPEPQVDIDTAPAMASPAPDGASAPPARGSAPSVLILSEAGARPAAPPAQPDRPGVSGAANVVIDTISYDAEGEVLLAGRAVPDALVRLYLNNDLVETAEVSPEGLWEARVAGIAQGVYTLRADEVTPDGKVISRFETPFERALRADAVLAAEAAAEAAEAETAAATVAEVPPGHTAAPGEVPVLEAAPGALAVAGVVTVQPGFTLWQIARENYGDGFQYVRVFQSNRDRIRDPDLIYPGQVFAVPRETP